jgi:uncharacterized phage-associated protein
MVSNTSTGWLPPYDGRAVANYLLEIGERLGRPLSQLQVLKLLYFSHGWFLVTYGTPLVEQNFEAWEHGPVVRVVRDAFKRFGKGPITSKAERLDIFTGEVSEVSVNIIDEHKVFIENIYRAYCNFDAWELSGMTHEKDSPWDRIWNCTEPIGKLALRIDNNDIRSHFSELSSRVTSKH